MTFVVLYEYFKSSDMQSHTDRWLPSSWFSRVHVRLTSDQNPGPLSISTLWLFRFHLSLQMDTLGLFSGHQIDEGRYSWHFFFPSCPATKCCFLLLPGSYICFRFCGFFWPSGRSIICIMVFHSLQPRCLQCGHSISVTLKNMITLLGFGFMCRHWPLGCGFVSRWSRDSISLISVHSQTELPPSDWVSLHVYILVRLRTSKVKDDWNGWSWISSFG